MDANQGNITVKDASSEQVTLSFNGCLTQQTVADFWTEATDIQQRYQPQVMTIDVKSVTYCDSAGIALLMELKERQYKQDHDFVLNGLTSKHQDLIAVIAESPYQQPEHEESPQRFPETVGKYIFRLIDNVKDNIIFLGMVWHFMLYSLLHPRTIRWRDFLFTLETVGPNALGIIALIGFLVGLISAFQSAVPLGRFSAQIYIANLVGIGLVKEMGPLMTAVLLAGRTASAFAAELGTMKINQEIDALTTMGLDPVRFLTVPRIIATTLMTPLLNIFFIFFGLVGAGLVMQHLGFNYAIYTKQVYDAVTLTDFTGGMIKAVVFGIVIAGVGCLHGLKTKYGASAVGNSTTQAVVTSLIMIVIVDGIFATIYYVLGI